MQFRIPEGSRREPLRNLRSAPPNHVGIVNITAYPHDITIVEVKRMPAPPIAGAPEGSFANYWVVLSYTEAFDGTSIFSEVLYIGLGAWYGGKWICSTILKVEAKMFWQQGQKPDAVYVNTLVTVPTQLQHAVMTAVQQYPTGTPRAE